MKFALNYSVPAAQMVGQGMIHIDLFKCADWPGMIADAQRFRPVYVHFPLEVGGGDEHDLQHVEALRRGTKTPHVNTHLVCRRAAYPDMAAHRRDGRDDAVFVRRATDDLRPLVDRFQPDNVTVENVIYHGPDRDDWLMAGVVPEVLADVIRQSGCGLLLDLSHARISAHHMGVDPKAYIESLPVDRLRELHVTGMGLRDGALVDHLAMTPDDWAFLDWALSRIRSGDWATPHTVAFEYGGVGKSFAWRTDPAVIASQVPRLYDLVHNA